MPDERWEVPFNNWLNSARAASLFVIEDFTATLTVRTNLQTDLGLQRPIITAVLAVVDAWRRIDDGRLDSGDGDGAYG